MLEWSPGQKVTARLVLPPTGGAIGVVLAHGAGAGQDHPWLVTLRTAIVSGGLPTLTFDYPYMEAGRKAPDRMERLVAAHRAAVERMRTYVDAVVLAGKSMGGRIGAHLVADEGEHVAGLVYYGYPLVPLGKRAPRPTDHLERIIAPQLFFAGTRDRLSPPHQVAEVAARLPAARLVVVEDADHSFAVPKRSGRTREDVLGGIAAETVQWVRSQG